MKPLLSIMVPTKGRYSYLKQLIDLVLSFESQDFELVIQDNTEDNTPIKDFLAVKDDDRLKYYYESASLTSVQNFDKAVLNTTGKYVLFIGDDDFVLRNVVDVVLFMEKNNIEAVKFRRANYYWPDSIRNKSILTTGYFSGLIEYLSPLDCLKKVFDNGCQEIDLLPSLYYGIIRKDILNQIYDIGGTYFPGNSADIASGVALTFVVKKYAYVKLPIIVPGTSRCTGGGVLVKKGKSSRLEDLSFISKDAIKMWDSSLPKVWHGSIVWPESALSALRYMGKNEFKNFLNFDAIWMEYSKSSKEAYIEAKNRYSSITLFYFEKLIKFQKRCFVFLLNRIIKLFTSNCQYKGHYYLQIGSIIEAESFLYKKIETYTLKSKK